MIFKKLTLGSAAASMLLLGAAVPMGAMAAGFQVTTHSAEGLGRAYAGEGAVTDNASALARNPAAAVEVADKALSVSAVYIDPELDQKNTSSNALLPGVTEADDVVESAVVPGIYYVQRQGKMGFGVGLKSDYGSHSDYPDNFIAGPVAGETKIKTVNLGLNAAYQVHPKLSVGAGVHFVKADAELNRQAFVISNFTDIVTLEGEDEAVTWSLGAIYKPAQGHQYSVSYREKTRLKLDGEGTNLLGGVATPVDATADITLPEILEISGTNKVANATSVQYSVAWTRWDQLQSLIAERKDNGLVLFGTPGNQARVNQRRYALGVTHDVNPNLTLRAGVALDEEAQKGDNNNNGAGRHFSNPDADKMWYTAGGTYKFNNNASLDMAVGYVKLEDVDVSESSTPLVFTSEQEGDGLLVGMQYNHKF